MSKSIAAQHAAWRRYIGVDPPRWWARLVCLLRGHQPVRRFDKVVLRDVDPLVGARFDVTKQSRFCRRCGKDPL